MKINVTGIYKITYKNKPIINGKNLITLRGEAYFLNRLLNDEMEPIQYLVLGKGTGRPLKGDNDLFKPKLRKEFKSKIDLYNKSIILTCDIPAHEIIGMSEIGVSNKEILISHDTFTPITDELLQEDLSSTVQVEYTFNLSTGGARKEWKQSTIGNNIWYVYEPNNVVGVLENTTNSGYARKESVEDLIDNPNTYYYNNKLHYVYINNKSPGDDELIILTK